MTITARNYAAQAEKYLRTELEKFPYIGMLSTQMLREVALRDLSEAVHFSLPDKGVTLIDHSLKALQPKEGPPIWNLPFPVITLEFFTPVNTFKCIHHPVGLKTLIMLHEASCLIEASDHWLSGGEQSQKDVWKSWFCDYDLENRPDGRPASRVAKSSICDEGVYASVLYSGNMKGTWLVSPHGFRLRKDSELGAYELIALHGENPGLMQSGISELYRHYAEVVWQFLNALACSNVHIDTLQHANAKRNARVKAGKTHKTPIYETKYLTIEVPGRAHQDAKSYGTGRTPREHLRRGHIRRCHSGKAVWVNACVVSAGNGRIDKQYRVKPNTQVA